MMKKTIFALLNLILGTLLGLAGFEALLQANPRLLLRGMNASVPLDYPLSVQRYEVHYSDGDAFRWRPDLVRPLQPGEDRLESSVVFQTDEFGFRNTPPLPENVDIVALGRSHTLAAHLPGSWTQLLAEGSGWTVLNLAQPGSGIVARQQFWQRYGKIRHPRWVVIEVVPSIDIVGSKPLSAGYKNLYKYSPQLLSPIVQSILKRWTGSQIFWQNSDPIYPLEINLQSRSLHLTCCAHYLEFFTLNQAALQSSLDWENYQHELLKLVQMVRQESACVALLIIPTKPDSYFPLVVDAQQLAPTLREVKPLIVDDRGWITSQVDGFVSIDSVVANADAGRSLIAAFAQQNHLALIDPTTIFREHIQNGEEPFMVYDSHWNQLGHELAAQLIMQVLQSQSCP
jgi:hypothetical protein